MLLKKGIKTVKMLAVLITVCMVFTGTMTAAWAESSSPSEIANKYEVDGITYYKVTSTNFSTSSKAFFDDMLTTESSEIGGKSAADNWGVIGQKIWDKKSKLSTDIKSVISQILTENRSIDTTYILESKIDLTAADSAKLAEDMILKEISKEGGHTYEGCAPLATLQDSVGQLQSETTGSPALYMAACHGMDLVNFGAAYAIIFSDFKVNPLIPEDKSGNYVTTIIKDTSSDGSAYASEVQNSTAVETTAEQSLSTDSSYSVSSEVNGSKSYSIGTSITIGAEHEFALMTASFETEFSSSVEVENGWSKSEEHSATKAGSSTVGVTLPPYTGIMLKQTETNQEVRTQYNCPVSISYRVRVIEYEYNTASAGTIRGEVLADFEADSQASLYQRAVVEKNYTDKDGIKWSDFDSDEAVKAAVDAMSDSVPVASTPAVFTEKLKVVKSSVDYLMPINPLRIIQMTEQDDEVELNVGETLRVDNIALEGLNANKYAYYGFDPDYGKWIICDENGNELTDGAIAALQKNTNTGRITLTAAGPGTVYLKYIIDEDKYGTWKDPDVYAKNSDLTKTAVIEVTVKESSTPPTPDDPVSIQDAKVVLSSTAFTYNAKVQKPTIKTINGLTLKDGTDYTAAWSNASSKNVGTYTVTITGTGKYTGTTKATYKINKAANPLAIKAKTASVKYSKLKKKAQTLAVTKVIRFTKDAKDKKTYTLSSAKKGKKSFKKYFTINKSTGKVTVKKGLKKGTYKVKVKVKALGNSNYNASAVKTVTFKVKVK